MHMYGVYWLWYVDAGCSTCQALDVYDVYMLKKGKKIIIPILKTKKQNKNKKQNKTKTKQNKKKTNKLTLTCLNLIIIRP